MPASRPIGRGAIVLRRIIVTTCPILAPSTIRMPTSRTRNALLYACVYARGREQQRQSAEYREDPGQKAPPPDRIGDDVVHCFHFDDELVAVNSPDLLTKSRREHERIAGSSDHNGGYKSSEDGLLIGQV
jgi:hypothetical protein